MKCLGRQNEQRVRWSVLTYGAYCRYEYSTMLKDRTNGGGVGC